MWEVITWTISYYSVQGRIMVFFWWFWPFSCIFLPFLTQNWWNFGEKCEKKNFLNTCQLWKVSRSASKSSADAKLAIEGDFLWKSAKIPKHYHLKKKIPNWFLDPKNHEKMRFWKSSHIVSTIQPRKKSELTNVLSPLKRFGHTM